MQGVSSYVQVDFTLHQSCFPIRKNTCRYGHVSLLTGSQTIFQPKKSKQTNSRNSYGKGAVNAEVLSTKVNMQCNRKLPQ